MAPVAQCLPVPKGLSDVEAASLPETFFTVWSNVFDRGRLQTGETLLIQGGTSGIGVTAIQMAKALGATGDRHGRQRRQVRGLPEARRRPRHQLQDRTTSPKRSKKLTGGKGVDVILDMVAGAYVAREIDCLAEDGRLVIIAVQGGVKSEFNAGLVLRKRLHHHRLDPAAAAGGLQGCDRAGAARPRSGRCWRAAPIKPVIHSTFAGRRHSARKAHALMESNQHIGKIVLTW